MWGRNLVNTIQTVAQAVAPPADSDDEEYEEYTDEEEEEQEEDEAATAGRAPLGLVDLLTRAMDNQDPSEEEEEVEDERNCIADQHLEHEESSSSPQEEDNTASHSPPPQLMTPQKRESGTLHAGLLKMTPETIQQLHMLDLDASAQESPDEQAQPSRSTVTQQSASGQQVKEGKASVAAPVHAPVIPALNGDGDMPQYKEFDKRIDPVALSSKPMRQRGPDVSAVTFDERRGSVGGVQRQFAPHNSLPIPPSNVDSHEEKTFSPSASSRTTLESPASPLRSSKPAVTTRPSSQTSARPPSGSASQVKLLEERCQQLEGELSHARQELAIRDTSNADDLDVLTEQFQLNESKRLRYARQKHQQELETITLQFQTRMEQMTLDFEQEQKAWEQEKRQLAAQQLQNQSDVRRMQQEFTKQQKQLMETMASLDEREHQVLQLRQTIKSLENVMEENKETHMENEDILEEVHQENDQLRNHVEQAEARCQVLKSKVEELQHQQEKFAHMQMELRLMKEELEREKAKSQSAVVAATSDNHMLEEERDAALASVEDYKQQLAAIAADLDIARADYQRAVMANDNLQSALESFQTERETELAMLEERRRESETAADAAHAATLEALKGAHAEQLRRVQSASDETVQKNMQEIKNLESQLKKYESENIMMRRSLDEAIHRLQMNQEDVIDRTLMKNILMDWLTKTGVKERKDVLELMASVLHFSEEEKERVNITSHHIAGGILGKLAAPVPPPKADMENLPGETVGEKWVNFLLAETDD